MLDQALAGMMQRLVSREAASVAAGALALRLHELGMGRIRGKTLHLSDRDRKEMEALLLARGFATAPQALDTLSRSDRLAVATPFEKAGGGAVKRERVSVKALEHYPLRFGGASALLPAGCHIDAPWPMVATENEHDAILLVENYETFDQIHRIAFDFGGRCVNPLVLYRGDRTESRLDNVISLIEAVRLPVLAFVDIDPKGLHIAASCPRLAGVLAPNRDQLIMTLSMPSAARHDLYARQVGGVEQTLSGLPSASPITPLWALLREYRSGAVQERWLADGTQVVLWPGQHHPPIV